MNWFTGVMVYIVVWWLVWFTLLPIGNRPPETVEPGHAESAPDNPRLWQKAIAASILAGLIWLAADYAIESDWISFRQR